MPKGKGQSLDDSDYVEGQLATALGKCSMIPEETASDVADESPKGAPQGQPGRAYGPPKVSPPCNNSGPTLQPASLQDSTSQAGLNGKRCD